MNISKRTIDYYTQIGLLHPVRTDSNYRLYGEDTIKALELIVHYKKLNMPLQEIKKALDLVIKEKSIDTEKIEKHLEQIAHIMHHLEGEIKEMKPILEKLNDNQKENLVNKISPQGITLAQTLMLLFG
jgi:DNA-binding transcriptional MerR regulator